MKIILIAIAIIASLSGCVITDPYYVRPQYSYIEPRPVYIPSPIYYRNPQPAFCYYEHRWDHRHRGYRSVRVCR